VELNGPVKAFEIKLMNTEEMQQVKDSSPFIEMNFNVKPPV
jgi:hypothetical protein